MAGTTGGAVAQRLAALRADAATDPAEAQQATWAWIQELGEKRDANALEALFASGTAPVGLDGPTEGILVATLTNPLVDLPVKLLTSAWMPWQGKSFDAANQRGINLMTESSSLPSKLLWPRYGMREAAQGRVAFDFETGVEPGAIEPKVDVLKIDYGDIEENPDLIIRKIRDELVELVPDTYLGRILFRISGGFSNIGYFALKQPAGAV